MTPAMRALAAVSLAVVMACGVSAQTTSRLQPHTEAKGDDTFQLTGDLAFEGKLVRGSIRRDEIAPLLDRRVELTGNADRYGLNLTDDNGRVVRVFTCREWAKHTATGASAATTYAISMESYFVHACVFLSALEEALPARKSFVAKPHAGLSNLELLPVDVLDSLDENGMDRLAKLASRGARLKSLVAKKIVRVERRTRLRLDLVYGETRTVLSEQGRADFDGDGVEDIFVLVSSYVTSGTLRTYGCLLLTRRNASSAFEVRDLDTDTVVRNAR